MSFQFQKWYEWAYAKKMWIGSIVAGISHIINLIQVAAADKAISFDEADGIKLAVISLLGTIGVGFGVYHSKNETKEPPS